MTESFTPDVARSICELRADAELRAEIQVLRERASAGELSIAQEAAYKDFVEALDVLSIIQSKARQYLKRCG